MCDIFRIDDGSDYEFSQRRRASSQAWGYVKSSGSAGEFSLLTNGKGSCLRRQYDAKISARVLPKLRSMPGDYTHTFAKLMAKWKPLPAPPDVRIKDIEDGLPHSVLSHLQQNAGLTVTSAKHCSVAGPGRASILNGTDRLINDALGLRHLDFSDPKAALHLSGYNAEFDAAKLLQALYAQVMRNWDGCPGRSKEIWRWKAMPYISDENKSLEKTLEKAIVNLNIGWVNQIPVASGLLRSREEGHICIDLGYKSGPKRYELIELKIGDFSETPLRAAFQILKYGILYFFARINSHRLDVPSVTGVLAAERVDLKVLAPLSCYEAMKLNWLSRMLNEGLAQFCKEMFGKALVVSFYFESFSNDFRWPGANDEELARYLSRRISYDL